MAIEPRHAYNHAWQQARRFAQHAKPYVVAAGLIGGAGIAHVQTEIHQFERESERKLAEYDAMQRGLPVAQVRTAGEKAEESVEGQWKILVPAGAAGLSLAVIVQSLSAVGTQRKRENKGIDQVKL